MKPSAKHIIFSSTLVPLGIFSLLAFTAQAQKQSPAKGQGYIIQLSSPSAPSRPPNLDELMCRHIYGIAWEGKAADNLKFAKQMGHTHVMYQRGMEDDPLAANLYFLLESPDYMVYASLNIDRQLDLKKKYSPQQKETYSTFFALKDARAPFPENIATGFPRPKGSSHPLSFSVEPDWQQQKVIDYFVKEIVALARKKERPEKKFLFGGLAWDVPNLSGDFHAANAKDKERTSPTTLAHWTGKDVSAVHPGNTHEYPTYSDGKAAYFVALKSELRKAFAGRRLIYLLEPYRMYEHWIQIIENRPDRNKLMEDALIVSEGGGKFVFEFADDPRVFRSGLLKQDWAGSTVPNDHEFPVIKEVAAKAAIHGSWFGWFGRFNAPGKPMDNIYEIPSWEQLARVVANWDNLNGVPLSERQWNGQIYSSPNSCLSDAVIYSRQPGTQKLFVVIRDAAASIPLKPGEKISSIRKVDNLFCEAGDASGEFAVEGNVIRLKRVK